MLGGAPWWSVLATAAAICSALISAGGLFFVGRQISLTRKANNLAELREFRSLIAEHEANLVRASTEEKQSAFLQLADVIEIYALACNERLLPAAAEKVVSEKLIDSIAVVEEAGWDQVLVVSQSSETNFQNIRRFIDDRRIKIDKTRAYMRSREH